MFLIGLGIQIQPTTGLNIPVVFIGEIIGTAVLTFGISAVVFGKIANGATGAVIGGSLTLGVIIAVLIGVPGFLNPAVALGAQSLTFTTLLGPIIGGVLGMQAYKFLVEDKR